LAKELGYDLAPEVARDVLPLAYGEDLSSASVEERIARQAQIMVGKLERTYRTIPDLVTDRCLVDVVAYSLYWLSRERDAQEFLDHSYALAMMDMASYGCIILVPPFQEAVPEDGVRCPERWYQGHIQTLIRDLLHDFPHRELVSTTLEDRLQECLDYVRERATVSPVGAAAEGAK
jgi:hypothetical protein